VVLLGCTLMLAATHVTVKLLLVPLCAPPDVLVAVIVKVPPLEIVTL
jgi:hypothetical protein